MPSIKQRQACCRPGDSVLIFFTQHPSFFAPLAYFPRVLYIDPSAVTYVIQAVAGAAIAVGAACTVYRHKIMKFFRTWKKKRARKKHQSAEQE